MKKLFTCLLGLSLSINAWGQGDAVREAELDLQTSMETMRTALESNRISVLMISRALLVVNVNGAASLCEAAKLGCPKSDTSGELCSQFAPALSAKASNPKDSVFEPLFQMISKSSELASFKAERAKLLGHNFGDMKSNLKSNIAVCKAYASSGKKVIEALDIALARANAKPNESPRAPSRPTNSLQ